MSRGRRGAPAVAAAGVAAAVAGTGGCTPYRIEYHERPAFVASAVEGDLPDRIVRDDGTVVVYRRRDASGRLQEASRGEEERPFLIREELEDGRVVLRALLPEHVLANTMNCLRNHEYELIWEQLLAERTRQAYAAQGLGLDAFASFFREHRRELAATVNRMIHGLPRHEVVSETVAPGVIRLRFHPTVGTQFTFRTVLLVSEGLGLKLLRIE